MTSGPRLRTRIATAAMAVALVAGTAVLVPAATARATNGAGRTAVASHGASAAAGAAPAYTFHDLGTIDVVGYPRAISDTGAVALGYGVWSKGAFTKPPVPGPNSANTVVSDISPDGVAVGTAGDPGPCAMCFAFSWDQRHGSAPQYYGPYPDLYNSNNQLCGGVSVRTIDATDEVGGTIAYVNHLQNPPHAVCTAGDTTPAGFIAASPGSADTHLDVFSSIHDLKPLWALGAGPTGLTVLYDRTHGTATQLTTLDMNPFYSTHELASDGGLIAGLNPSEAPQYRAPNGTLSALKAPAGDSTPLEANAINDGHEIVGASSEHVLLWPTPSSVPVTLESSPTVPAADTLLDATAISNEGDIAGTFQDADGVTHAYVLSVATNLEASIALTNPDASPFTGAGSKVGDTLIATVTLTNSSPTFAVTGLTANPALTVAPSGALQLQGGPVPVVPTSLAATAHATYVMTYKIAALGAATLSVAASGTQNTLPASASASVVTHLGQVLSVKVAFQNAQGVPIPDATIKMADTDSGEVPMDLIAVVTVKNVGTVQQDNVAFNGPLVASFHSSTEALPTVPVTVTSGPTPPDPLGNLAVGATVVRKYGLHVTNNGVFDLDSQVTSGNHGGNGTNVSFGVGTLTANPTAILFLSLHPVTDVSKLLKPGSPVLVAGQLVNRSQTQSIDLTPVEPTADSGDNAGGGEITDASVSPLPDGVRVPLSGEIAPATTVEVDAEIDTAPVGGTRAMVKYAPTGYLIASDGTEAPLDASQIRVAAGSSPIEIHLDTRDPVDTAGASALAGEFAKSAFIGVSEWYLNGFKAGLGILQHPVDTTVKFAVGAAGFVVHATTAAREAARMVGAMYALTIYYEALTPEERGNFANQIVADYETTSLKTAHQALQAAADPVLVNFFNALETGNFTKVAQMSGSGLATGTTAVADILLADIAFQKIALLSKARTGEVAGAEMEKTISLADSLAQAGVKEGKAGAALKNIFAGQNLLAKAAYALRETYGLTDRQVKLLVQFCKSNGITVALRARSARAAELIRRGIAIGKNLVIKLKNVDEIDVAFLGYAKGDLNTVVWAQPITENKLLWNMRHLAVDDPVRQLATKRWQQRVAEWANKDYQEKIAKWTLTKRIQLAFDGAGSLVGELDHERTVYRRFAMEDRSKLQGRYYQKLQVGIRAGENAPLAFITQDVDLVALLGGDNSILLPKLRAKAYEFLENILGIQHPDTIPWIQNGEVAFEAKSRLLIDHIEGGEALAVFGADGSARAGFFEPYMTVFNTVTKGGYVFFKGAYNNPYGPVAIGSLGKLLAP